MWPGPYGDWGSRKYLLARLDQSLKRMGLEYVDIFYSHRPDPETPLEETMGALDQAVRSGKALYAGISSYDADQAAVAVKILRDLGTPCLIHQPKYSMFERGWRRACSMFWARKASAASPSAPLAQGLLTDRYLHGIPAGSRASKPHGFLKKNDIDEHRLAQVRALEQPRRRTRPIACTDGTGMGPPRQSSDLRPHRRQPRRAVEQNVAALANLAFTAEELTRIDAILNQSA